MNIPKSITEISADDLISMKMPRYDFQSLLSDAIDKLYDEREEMLLAVLAAGVPANCIALTGPSMEGDYEIPIKTITAGFQFIRSI